MLPHKCDPLARNPLLCSEFSEDSLLAELASTLATADSAKVKCLAIFLAS